jgi:hypothetical protein
MVAVCAHGPDLIDLRSERVTINGYRSSMAGYELGDPACWDDLWNNLVSEAGLESACAMTGCLQYFV